MTGAASRRIATLIVITAVLLMAWHMLAPAEPTPYDPTYNISWGVSFYPRLPFAFQILGLLFFLAAMAWAILAPLTPTPSTLSITNPDSWPRSLWRWLPLILALLGVLLFTIFPVSYSEGDSGLFNRLSPQRLILEPEPLDYYLKYKLYQALSPILTRRTDAFQIMAVVAGFFYILAAFLLSSRVGRDRRETLVILGGLFTIANILFFFRYVETYAFVTAASLLLIWACLLYLDGKIRLTLVAAIAMITALFHGSGFFWLPMILTTWLLRVSQYPAPQRWPRALKEALYATLVALGIFATFVLIIVLDGYTIAQFQDKIDELGGKGSGMFIPLFPYPGMPEPYAFFSWSHLGSILQQQLLIAPMALLTIAIVLATSWNTIRSLTLRQPAIIILAMGSITLFLYSILWNPDLGSRNDWDLLALPAIPLTLLALYLLLQLPNGKPKRLAITAYLALSCIHTLGWLLLHTLALSY